LLLTSLLFRNTVLSSLVLPSQLTSRPPAVGLCGSAITFVLSKVNGGARFEPWQDAEDAKNMFVTALESGSAGAVWEEFEVSTVDGVALSAAAYTSPGAVSRWIVFVPPNGQQWESVVFSVAQQAIALGANFLVFNYRGVGRSGGVAQTSAELVLDCEAALDWLMVGVRSVRADQILLHGHSLGGGVGLQVLRRRAERGDPPIAMIHDRSFTSVAQVVARHPFVRREAGTPGPALLCAGFGGVFGSLALLLVSPSYAGRPHAVIRLAAAAALGHGLGDFLAKHLLQLDKPPEDWCACVAHRYFNVIVPKLAF
jgi:pimeloyl-ACP methyl ester carboxylesterase